MKILFLIAAKCLFVAINSQSVASDETFQPTIEDLTQEASAKFNEFSIEQSQINTDVLYDFVYTKYDALSEKLERLACKRSSDLLVAKSDALSQLAQTIENLRETSSATAIKLCLITAKIDISLYVDPELQTGIQTELMYYKSTLSQFQSNSYSLFTNTDSHTQYNNEVYGENVTVESLQKYISSLDSLMLTYKYTIKSTAQSFVYDLQNFVQNFEYRGQEKNQNFQSMLYNVNSNFQTCVSNYYYL